MRPRLHASLQRGRRGFTLLEIMVSVALMGLVLVGMNFFVFSMGELWGKGGERRLFEQHVRAVSRFLETELRRAALPPTQAPGAPAFLPEEMRPSGGLAETLLSFELLEGCRLLNWKERALPEVVCALQVRQSQGLFLLWRSRLELDFKDMSPREVLVSPHVASLAYEYYDAELRRWSREYSLKRDNSGKYLAPDRLALRFSYRGMITDTVINLAKAGEGLPVY